MMHREKPNGFTSHESYFLSVPAEPRARLQTIQHIVESLFPNSSQCISYNIPAFKAGRVFFYFAAFKNHIGIYPPVMANQKLIEELKPYRNEKGNLSFPLNQPLPIQLITRVASALHDEYSRT